MSTVSRASFFQCPTTSPRLDRDTLLAFSEEALAQAYIRHYAIVEGIEEKNVAAIPILLSHQQFTGLLCELAPRSRFFSFDHLAGSPRCHSRVRVLDYLHRVESGDDPAEAQRLATLP